MFIQTENTPNPDSIKFIPENIGIISDSPVEFKNEQQVQEKSIIAKQLFMISGVKSIFFGKNFITITKQEDEAWLNLKTEILTTIMDFCSLGKPFLNQDESLNQPTQEDSDIVKQIKELIEVKVRPAVAMDGGDIIYHSFDDGIVKLELKGSCAGCPSSTVTLKHGIENMLKHYIPEVESVEQIFED